MTRTSMRSMMLPPKRHASAFDVLLTANELSLSEIQLILQEGTMDERKIVYNEYLARDRTMRLALLASFDAGYRLPAKTVYEFERHNLTDAVPEAWSSTNLFDDDATFVPERFVILLSYHARRNTISPGWGELAAAQAKRLLAAGRVDVEYLRSVSMLRGSMSVTDTETYVYFERELLSYMPLADTGSHERQTIGILTGIMASTPDEGNARRNIQAEIDKSQLRLDVIMARREWLFHHVWLPVLLPTGEYAAVRELPGSMLRELYHQQWAQGYDAYRAFTLARDNAA